MAWTLPTGIFFAGIGALLVIMAVWEWRRPGRLRRGFLPLPTTRGDRLFISLLAAAYINLGWIGIGGWSAWYGLALSAMTGLAIMRWG